MNESAKTDDTSNDDNDKVKNSKYHTLFEESKCENKKQVTIDGKEYCEITPSYKKYRMFIDSFGETERGLHEIFNTLWNAGDNDELELRVNSWGGMVKEGQNFYNLINNKFNGRTTTVLDSAGYSMGALLFCAGDERVCMEEADLMFHNYSDFAFGKGGEIKSQVKHTEEHLKKFFKKAVVSTGFMTKKEFKQMLLGKDFWMDVPEMCMRGIATHVMVDGKKISSKKYLKSLKKKK